MKKGSVLRKSLSVAARRVRKCGLPLAAVLASKRSRRIAKNKSRRLLILRFFKRTYRGVGRDPQKKRFRGRRDNSCSSCRRFSTCQQAKSTTTGDISAGRRGYRTKPIRPGQHPHETRSGVFGLLLSGIRREVAVPPPSAATLHRHSRSTSSAANSGSTSFTYAHDPAARFWRL